MLFLEANGVAAAHCVGGVIGNLDLYALTPTKSDLYLISNVFMSVRVIPYTTSPSLRFSPTSGIPFLDRLTIGE